MLTPLRFLVLRYFTEFDRFRVHCVKVVEDVVVKTVHIGYLISRRVSCIQGIGEPGAFVAHDNPCMLVTSGYGRHGAQQLQIQSITAAKLSTAAMFLMPLC